MPRRYRRRRYAISRPLKTAKYSNETYTVQQSTDAGANLQFQKSFPVVPDTSVLATRKCKNFTLKLGILGFTGSTKFPGFYWVLAFVPQGVDPSLIQTAAQSASAAVSLYEPNQNVIMSGVITDSQTHTYKTRLARNLNSGDEIALIVLVQNHDTANPITVEWASTINYAISY